MTHIDVERRVVATSAGREHAYDYLILAAGARHAYFNHPEWEPLAPGLKSVDDAIELRRRILTAFERAEATDDAEERAAWLTFVIVGGGPTGVGARRHAADDRAARAARTTSAGSIRRRAACCCSRAGRRSSPPIPTR